MVYNTALSGMNAASKDLQVTGNNIANASTTGFKQSTAEFADIYQVSSLGVAGNTPGAGVRLSSINQDFSQGSMEFTNKPLDLGISGSGFFVVQDVGSRNYTRSGSFGTDRDGIIVNSTGQQLLGYQVDANGNSTGVLGTMTIDRADSPPNATTAVDLTMNLNSSESVPTDQWMGTASFGGALPDSDTYNQVTSMAIFDSMGFEHVLSSYFVKSGSSNTWHARFQVDGVDVDNPAARANSITSQQPTLVSTGTLPTLAPGELTINGTGISAPLADGLSNSDSTASARAIVTAINNETGTTGVTATAADVTLNMGTYVPGTINAGELTINGTNIVVGVATQTGLINAINAQTATTHVAASTDSSGNIVLTTPSTDAHAGRNIVIGTDGTSATATFSNFSLTTGAATSVQRGQYTLSSNAAITVAGTAPTDANILPNTYLAPWALVFNPDGTVNTSQSDNISLVWSPLDSSGNPTGAVSPQTFTIDLDQATQFGSPFSVSQSSQDGYESGRLSQIEVDENGYVNARFSNGQSQVLGQVALAFFENETGLSPVGDTQWGESYNSGPPVIGEPGTSGLGKLQSGALETSNVDLSQELVNLIIAQRNFQANARSIETGNTITQAVINIR